MGKTSQDRILPLRLGVIGTAKNTGKTTTLISLMQEAHKRHIPLAVTGIGYDGEAIDNLTLLPKPRLDVFPGTFVGTAEVCLRQATAGFRNLEQTPEQTSLGKIHIVETIAPGRVLLVGPNNTDALNRVLGRFDERIPLILVDGALGRMVPMSAADVVIFATGAARSTHVPHLVREMMAIEQIFSLRELKKSKAPGSMPDLITLFYLKNKKHTLESVSLLGKEEARQIAALWNPDLRSISIPGAAAASSLKQLLDHAPSSLAKVLFHFHSPANLLAGGKPLVMLEKLKEISRRGGGIAYHKPLPVLAVTINPFYPRQKGRRCLFEAAYVDENHLFKEFSSALSVPVFNIQKQGAQSLFDLIPIPKGRKKK